jgi:hypothetical protein
MADVRCSYELSLTYAQQAVTEAESLHRRVATSLGAANATRVGRAGAALGLVNCPPEAAALGVDSSIAATLEPLQRNVAQLRAELMPA